MITSPRGQRAIQNRENCILTAYRDIAGIWTIGFGQTGPNIKEGTVWKKQQAIDAFKQALVLREAAINTFVTVHLTQNQFDALVSFVYNVGISNFKNSTLLRILNQSLYNLDKQFFRWNKITDPTTYKLVVSNGLSNRRRAEALQFNTPDPPPTLTGELP